MRQSIHRGIDASTNKMVQGCLNWDEYEHPSIRIGNVDVIPETIGQFTHKVDSTGKDIFEGDYLRLYNYLYEVIFDTNTAAFLRKRVAWRGPDSQWYSGKAKGRGFWRRSYPFHVDPAMNGVVMGNKFNGLLEIVEG